ncbi:unnamed protein product [Macrosiphum euphorbiae]|uniref:H15 domain-containing protein n=1 Tax=Macrosiphum euphorbiae TaxID=13131 RepID=A0AAV0XC54_9HEMI|nr:unnamed protein product [Macrosiphum euphorbiae]
MASTATVPAASSVAPIAASTPKKTKTPTTKSAVAAPAHPSTAVMVIAAIKELNEKKGSSLSAIKKYMSTNYKVDSAKLAPFIRKFLKAAVVKGSLLQTNGTGAMGHFKLPVEVKKKPATVKKPSAAVVKRVAAKKPAAKSSSSGSPKKRRAAAAAEPAAKKPKAVTAKPKKSLVKAKKAVVAPKPPKAKKATTAVKKTKSPKKK